MQQFESATQLRDWLQGDGRERALCNGWVDAQGELHVWTQSNQMPCIVVERRGEALSLHFDAIDHDGRPCRIALVVREELLHVHPFEAFWSERALLPAFVSACHANVQGPWPVSALGLAWLHEAGLQLTEAVVVQVADESLCADFQQVRGRTLATRRYAIDSGTLHRAPLRSWPLQVPTWNALWHFEPAAFGEDFQVWDVAESVGLFCQDSRQRKRAALLRHDTDALLWVALTSGAHRIGLPEVLSVFHATPTRRRFVGARASRPGAWADSLLIIDADRFAARVWVDRASLGNAVQPYLVPHSPHIAARLPYGDWFVHGAAEAALRSPEAPSKVEAREAHVIEAATTATAEVLSGVDHYLDLADHRSGKLQVAVAIPAGWSLEHGASASAGPLRLLRSVASDVRLWHPPRPNSVGDAAFELSTAALAAAGLLVSCSRERSIVVACVVDMRGDETHIACVARAWDGQPPIVLAQERLSVGMLTWASAWIEPTHCDPIAAALRSLATDRATAVAFEFYAHIAQAAGTFLGLTLASPQAMEPYFARINVPSGIDLRDTAWGEHAQISVALDGWGFAPLWSGSGFSGASVTRVLGRLRDAVTTAMKGSHAAGTTVNVARPSAQGPRYLLDGYFAAVLPVTEGKPGRSIGPVGASGSGDGVAVGPLTLFDGIFAGDVNPQTPGMQWTLSPEFAAAGSAPTELTGVSSVGRLPWAVIVERRIVEAMHRKRADAVRAEASQMDPLAAIGDQRWFQRYRRPISDFLHTNQPTALTADKLAQLGVTRVRDRKAILDVLNPKELGPDSAPVVVPQPSPPAPPTPQFSAPLQIWCIGASADADIALWLPGVSRYHAELFEQGAALWLRDIGSASGTFVNGARVGSELSQVWPTDQVRFGGTASFQVRELLGLFNDPHLALAIGLGAASDNDIVIEEPSVSGHHARLLVAGDRLVVQDKESIDGTWLDDQRVVRATWKPNQKLRLGKRAVVDRQQIDGLLAPLRSQQATICGEWIVGSSDETLLRVLHPSVSARHLGVKAVNGVWMVRSLSSSTLSRIGGAEADALGTNWCPIHAGMVLWLGAAAIDVAQLMLVAVACGGHDAGPSQQPLPPPPTPEPDSAGATRGRAQPIQLQQGANLAVTGTRVVARLEWSPEHIDGADVDVSAFLLSASGRVRSDEDFVFYNAPKAPGGAVSLILGQGHAAFELQLDRMPDDIERIAFATTLAQGKSFASARMLKFTLVDCAYFAVQTQHSNEAAVIVAEIYRRKDQWKLRAVGQGFQGGLAPLARHFGVDVE